MMPILVKTDNGSGFWKESEQDTQRRRKRFEGEKQKHDPRPAQKEGNNKGTREWRSSLKRLF